MFEISKAVKGLYSTINLLSIFGIRLLFQRQMLNFSLRRRPKRII